MLGSCIWLIYAFRKHVAAPSFPEAVVSFTSSNPEGAVTIPFVLHSDGGIIVPAQINQQVISCFLDTGARDICTNTAIGGNSFIKAISYPISTGSSAPANFVNVPVIKLKDFCLSNVPIVALSSAYIPANCGTILGNYTFKRVTLTIDYAKCALTIYPANYDVSKRKRRPQDILLDLNFGGSNIAFSPEYLTVHGKLEGEEVDFVLDTGNVSDGILLSPRLRLKLRTVPVGTPPYQQYTMAGHSSLEFTRPLHWNLGQANGSLLGITMEMRQDWDALLGYQFLKNYRVTIDYPHRKLLLEPNDPGAAGPKLQNAAPAVFSTSPSTRIVLPSIPDGYCVTVAKDGSVTYYPCPKGELDAAGHKH